jgi:hypothetical protein
MNREAQSTLWFVIMISLVSFIVLTWACVIYDAIHESDRVVSVSPKNWVPPENVHRYDVHAPEGWVDGGY